VDGRDKPGHDGLKVDARPESFLNRNAKIGASIKLAPILLFGDSRLRQTPAPRRPSATDRGMSRSQNPETVCAPKRRRLRRGDAMTLLALFPFSASDAALWTASHNAPVLHPLAGGDALTLEGLCVTLGGRSILKSVSTRFESHAVTVVVGPSGAGKTTLLNVLNGLVAPSGGSISSRGLDLSGDARKNLRRDTAMIFQDHALIGRLSALDNVLLGFADRRHPLSLLPWPREMQLRALQALRDVGLSDRALERVENLSGGEKQRIGIARALARRPRLLLGDEPFSSLDLTRGRKLGEDLRALATRDGVTVVLALHQIVLARALADRIVGLKDGRIFFDGPAEAFEEKVEKQLFAPLAYSTALETC
jgi:phosphonate transport system ATP-binding protein